MNSDSNGIENLLFVALQSATSQDPVLLKQAEENLSSWEKEPNFYTTILNFYSNLQLEDRVRYMAILTLKNGIDRHWRKTQIK